MSKFAKLKFNIGDNPELSRLVQETLFELGYVWAGTSEPEVEHTDSCYLFTETRGSQGVILYSSDRSIAFFEDDSSEEFDLTELRQALEEDDGEELIAIDIETYVGDDGLTYSYEDDDEVV